MQTWDEYSKTLQAELYRLNMELSHWEARGEREIVQRIKTLITAIKRTLDSETRC
jgi:hypothetical protein